MITGMNHAVLYVRDARRHEAFYTRVLGFETVVADPDGIEFEVMWLAPPDTWGDEEHRAIVRPLDLAADLTTHGPDRRSTTHRSGLGAAPVGAPGGTT